MKVCVAAKGGVGKTTVAALLSRELASRGYRTLAVDCDPNPNLAESFGLTSGELERFSHDALRRAGDTLELVREPALVEIGPRLALLGGPPGATPLADAVARGIAGVLVAHRFDAVVTDLGAGPEFTRIAVGGVLNPADVCIVLSNGRPVADETAARIEAACRAREVPTMRAEVTPAPAERLAAELADRLARSPNGVGHCH